MPTVIVLNEVVDFLHEVLTLLNKHCE